MAQWLEFSLEVHEVLGSNPGEWPIKKFDTDSLGLTLGHNDTKHNQKISSEYGTIGNNELFNLSYLQCVVPSFSWSQTQQSGKTCQFYKLQSLFNHLTSWIKQFRNQYCNFDPLQLSDLHFCLKIKSIYFTTLKLRSDTGSFARV